MPEKHCILFRNVNSHTTTYCLNFLMGDFKYSTHHICQQTKLMNSFKQLEFSVPKFIIQSCAKDPA